MAFGAMRVTPPRMVAMRSWNGWSDENNRVVSMGDGGGYAMNYGLDDPFVIIPD